MLGHASQRHGGIAEDCLPPSVFLYGHSVAFGLGPDHWQGDSEVEGCSTGVSVPCLSSLVISIWCLAVLEILKYTAYLSLLIGTCIQHMLVQLVYYYPNDGS